MKFFLSKFILFIVDILIIAISILIAYIIRNILEGFFLEAHTQKLYTYLSFTLLYIVIITLFTYSGIYSRRFDFWHEVRQILRALLFAFIIILAYLGVTKTVQEYSRFVIITAFLIMFILIPLMKYLIKKFLFKIGFWKCKAKIYGGDDIFIKNEIFGNNYLGYVEVSQLNNNEEPKTVFINSKDINAEELKYIIDNEIANSHEVIFIPLLNEYDLTQSSIYELSNTRTNMIVLQNRLKSFYRIAFKQFLDIVLFCIAFPLLLPVLGAIAYLIRKEDPHGSIFFKQARIGKNNKTFICYKFRTMLEYGDDILRQYLKEHPEEVTQYSIYHKYKNDPRITKIGALLRKTSLDELPQIFNILKGEMSFVGPRPYMLTEKEKIGSNVDVLCNVKPGITGMWQVSGRSNVDFNNRVELDLWYIRNWNIWMDIVLLLKTIKVVLLKKGAS